MSEYYCTWLPFRDRRVVYLFASRHDVNTFVSTMRLAGHKECTVISQQEARKLISEGAGYYDAEKILNQFTIGFRIEDRRNE